MVTSAPQPARPTHTITDGAGAQGLAMPVIGFLDSVSVETRRDALVAFRQGLGDTGHLEGHNVAIEYRWAQGQLNRLPDLAADLVRRQVAVTDRSP